MRAGILDGFQTIIPTAAAVLLKKRQMLRLTQQEIADRAKITLRQYQRLKSGEKSHRFKGRHDAKQEQYGQIYVEKFTSASLICKAFYGKMKV